MTGPDTYVDTNESTESSKNDLSKHFTTKELQKSEKEKNDVKKDAEKLEKVTDKYKDKDDYPDMMKEIDWVNQSEHKEKSKVLASITGQLKNNNKDIVSSLSPEKKEHLERTKRAQKVKAALFKQAEKQQQLNQTEIE